MPLPNDKDPLRTTDHDPIAARPVGRIERAGKWVKRNPLVAGAAAVVVLVLVAGVIVSSYLAELKAHTDAVTSVSFSADGDRLLTASGLRADKPGEVFVWDARIGKEPPDEEEIAYRRLYTQPNPSPRLKK